MFIRLTYLNNYVLKYLIMISHEAMFVSFHRINAIIISRYILFTSQPLAVSMTYDVEIFKKSRKILNKSIMVSSC